MNELSLGEYYPFLHIDGHTLLTTHGDTVLCYACELPEVFTLSKDDYLNIHDFWFRMLKSMPSNSYLLKQDVFLSEQYDGDDIIGESFLQRATKKHFEGRHYLRHLSLLFIGSSATSNLRKRSLSNPFRKPTSVKEIKRELESDQLFIKEVNRQVDFLNSSRYIRLMPLAEEEIHTYLESYYNGFQSGFYGDTEFVSEDRKNGSNRTLIQVGKRLAALYTINSIRQWPEYADIYRLDSDFSSKKFNIFKGTGDDFGFRLPFDHVYNQFIYLDDHVQAKEELKSKRSNLYGARGFSEENATAAQNLTNYLKMLSEDEGRKLVRGHTNIIYYGIDAQEMEQRANKISTILKGLDFSPHYPNRTDMKEIYIKSAFPYAGTLTDSQLYQTELSVALTTFLNTTGYRSDERGVVFSDRIFNVPVKRDIRDEGKKRIKAWNFLVFAPTGEGKSVLMQHVFRQLGEQGYKLVIFDIGGSFRKLAYLQDPNKTLFFSYEPGRSLGINPFIIPDKKEPDVEFLDAVVDFIYRVWKPDSTVTNEVRTPLRKLLAAYYDTVAVGHSFQSFYLFVKENSAHIHDILEMESRFLDLKDFLLYCSDFMPGGQYGFLFVEKEKDRSIRLENMDMVVFEFDKAGDNEILLNLLMQLGSSAVNKMIWSNKKIEGVVFFDEMAKFVKYPSVMDTITFYFQAIRKQTGSVGGALQSPAQLPNSDGVQAMIDNTQVVYILFNEKGYDSIVQRFKLSEHQHNILKSITPNLKAKNPYTEFALIIGKEIWVLRLELPREAFLAYQTDGKAYEEIMDIYQQKNNMEQAILTYINQNPTS